MRNQDILLMLVAEKMKHHPMPETPDDVPLRPYVPLKLTAGEGAMSFLLIGFDPESNHAAGYESIG